MIPRIVHRQQRSVTPHRSPADIDSRNSHTHFDLKLLEPPNKMIRFIIICIFFLAENVEHVSNAVLRFVPVPRKKIYNPMSVWQQ